MLYHCVTPVPCVTSLVITHLLWASHPLRRLPRRWQGEHHRRDARRRDVLRAERRELRLLLHLLIPTPAGIQDSKTRGQWGWSGSLKSPGEVSRVTRVNNGDLLSALFLLPASVLHRSPCDMRMPIPHSHSSSFVPSNLAATHGETPNSLLSPGSCPTETRLFTETPSLSSDAHAWTADQARASSPWPVSSIYCDLILSVLLLLPFTSTLFLTLSLPPRKKSKSQTKKASK